MLDAGLLEIINKQSISYFNFKPWFVIMYMVKLCTWKYMVRLISFLSLCRFSPQWHSKGTRYTLWARASLQCERQLRPLQNHSSDMQLRQQGHFLLCPRCGTLTVPSTEARAGQTAPAHLRDSIPNEQRSTAEVCSVPYHSASHRCAADSTEAGRWNTVTELRDQPGPRWVEPLL